MRLEAADEVSNKGTAVARRCAEKQEEEEEEAFRAQHGTRMHTHTNKGSRMGLCENHQDNAALLTPCYRPPSPLDVPGEFHMIDADLKAN